MMPPWLELALLGLVVGIRHAVDPDHVVAVSTLLSHERTARRASRLGALWGIGHTLTIFVIGGAIILFRVTVPARLALALELVVAAMLVALGVHNLRRPPAARAGRAPSRARPIAVGVVHGVAGSAAVALLVMTTIADARWALAYLLVFGLGTIVGMTVITGALAGPAAWATARLGAPERWLRIATGAGSVALGLFLAHRIGWVDGLFGGPATWTPR